MLLTAISLALASSVAMAAEQGGYIGMDFGRANLSSATTPVSMALGTNNTFPNPGAYDINGGYRFSRNLAVEAGYVKLGDSSLITVLPGGTLTETLSSSAFYVAAIGSYPVSSAFDIYGKLGIDNVSESYSLVGTLGTNVSGSASHTNLTYAVGGAYHFNEHWAGRLQYAGYGDAGSGSVGINVLSLGAAYDF